jgi:DNA-binding GntR family transcriptional regulator
VPEEKKFRSKKEVVYQSLREQILSGELKPGARLIIDEISTHLSVSPIPVREALQQLQSDGLVTIEPYIGAHVTKIDTSLIHEVFALLEALEIISSQSACQQMSEIDFAEMELLLRRMDAEVEHPEQWSQGNLQLHQFICDQAGMSLVKEFFLRIGDHWDRLRRYYLRDVSSHRIPAAQCDHWKLLEALRTRNPDHVAEVVRNHNRSALADYLAYLDHTEQNGKSLQGEPISVSHETLLED